MAKVKMACPISKGPCVDCAIYRGRHFYLCFSKEYRGVSLGLDQIEELKAQYKKDKNGQDKIEVSEDIMKSPNWIEDVEDLVERMDDLGVIEEVNRRLENLAR
ncbi:MAG: hypothetical protein N2745_03310 [Syntrophorhabdaceae bacterium]|nr:hypothetical protein [Syntrophorhabdaceae bacterium]